MLLLKLAKNINGNVSVQRYFDILCRRMLFDFAMFEIKKNNLCVLKCHSCVFANGAVFVVLLYMRSFICLLVCMCVRVCLCMCGCLSL